MKRLISVLLVLLCVQCGKEKIPAPEAVLLLGPENNNNCTTAQIIDASQSQVNFSWQAALYTDTYELVVRNNTTNTQQKFSTTFTSKSILLSRGRSYSWWVISSAEISTATSESERWNFYLEGESPEQALPFPAQLLAPENNSLHDAGTISLTWEGGHPEGEVLRYQVYLGNSVNTLSALGELQSQSTFSFDAAAQQHYYWRVKSIQTNGDSSTSAVFQFQTR